MTQTAHTLTPLTLWQTRRLSRIAVGKSCHCYGDNALISMGLLRSESKSGIMGQPQVLVFVTDAGNAALNTEAEHA